MSRYSLTFSFYTHVLNFFMCIPFIILVPMMTVLHPNLTLSLYLSCHGTAALVCFLSLFGFVVNVKFVSDNMWSAIIVGVSMLLQICCKSLVFTIIGRSFRTVITNEEWFRYIFAADFMISWFWWWMTCSYLANCFPVLDGLAFVLWNWQMYKQKPLKFP